jgi:MFS family permease
MVAKYRTVLSLPGCARVFATALIGRLPQGMSSLAILLLVHSHTGSYVAAGIAVGAFAFATAASAPVEGRLVDRYGRRRVLVPSAIGQAMAFVGLVLAADAGTDAVVLIALAAIAGALLPPIAPSMRALLREIVVEPDQRETAYSLESVIQELIWITGPLLVAVVISLSSPAGAVLLSATVCVVGTILFVTSPRAGGSGTRQSHHERTPVLAVPELRTLLGPIALTGMALGAIEVGIPSLALHAGSRPASGLLLALWSCGTGRGSGGCRSARATGACCWPPSPAPRR